MKHTLIYGLSANPPHNGHVALIEGTILGLMAQGYALDSALLMPVFRRNPVGAKKDELPFTFEHRFAMSQITAAHINRRLPENAPLILASRLERDIAQANEKPNFTADTLRHLYYGTARDSRLMLLLSSEMFAGENPQFARWYEPETITRLATLVIAPRPEYEPNHAYLTELSEQGAKLVYLSDVETPNVSSSKIRKLLLEGSSANYLASANLIPKQVAAYITHHGLYSGV